MLARFERFPTFDTLADEVVSFGGDIETLFADRVEYSPPLDVSESNEEVVVVAEIPGVKKEDLKISLEKGFLSIGGERKGNGISGERNLVREQRQGKFTRTVRLPYEVNTGKVSAELSDGLLRIVLPKAEAARAHEITVR
jgi:HSP20 family protein